MFVNSAVKPFQPGDLLFLSFSEIENSLSYVSDVPTFCTFCQLLLKTQLDHLL